MALLYGRAGRLTALSGGFRPGQWVANQRKHKKKLDRGEPSEGMAVARAAKLEALGFAWELPAAAIGKVSQGRRHDAGWEAQLAKIEAFKRRHGDCDVPQGWVDDPALGRWVNTQRGCKKALDRGDPSDGMTAARAAKLEALGFAWRLSDEGGRHDAGWAAQLAKLKAYKTRHGDCDVPQSWAEDPKLGTWVSNQRACKKKLDRGEVSEGMTAARAAELEALGFAWQLSAAALSKQISKGSRDDAGWEAQLAKLKAYARRHGDCSVPQGWAEDPSLGRWVRDQRQRKRALDRGEPSKGMTTARVAKLEALGFSWAPPRGGAARRVRVCGTAQALPRPGVRS